MHSRRRTSLLLAASVFIVAGLLHFVVPEMYLRIVPPWLPAPLALVYASGAAELLGGIGLLVPRTRRLAGIGLVLLLAAVFPANIQMLLDAREAHAPLAAELLLWARLPLQPLLIVWVWRVSR